MKLKFYGGALAALMLGFIATSCSNELPDGPQAATPLSMKLAKAPEVSVWSGSQNLFGESSTRSEIEGEESEGVSRYVSDEVEVNLAISDVHELEDGTQKYDVDDLATKLSIHVRSGVDVVVTLPVPEEFYCDQDDLYIFNNHGGDLFANGGELENGRSEIEIVVGTKEKGGSLPSTGGCACVDGECNCDYHGEEGNCGCDNADCPCTRGTRAYEFADDELTTTVKLAIEFTSEAIIISTEGITQGVIDWCYEKFGDGLNIEVYNYYNRSNMPVVDEEGNVTGGEQTASYAAWSLSELKAALDGSTIEFVGREKQAPDYYINAFTGKTVSHGDELEYRDCYVRLTEQQGSMFNDGYYDYHYNGFEYNLIYRNKDVVLVEDEDDPAADKIPASEDLFVAGMASVPAE